MTGKGAFQAGSNHSLVLWGPPEDESHTRIGPHPNTREKDFYTQPYSHWLQPPRYYKLPEALMLSALVGRGLQWPKGGPGRKEQVQSTKKPLHVCFKPRKETQGLQVKH